MNESLKNGLVTYGPPAISLLAGLGGGYFAAKKVLEKKFDARLEAEIADTREHYEILEKKGDYETPQQAVQKLVGVEGYSAPTSEEIAEVIIRESVREVEVDVVQRNVFDTPEAVWDYEREVAGRSREAPYILSKEEFFNGDYDYLQVSLTLYEGDDVLADVNDVVVTDEEVSFDRDLIRFGHGSDDPNVVYIRDDLKTLDYEIVRSFTDYAGDVLGFKHSDQSMRRFRNDRDY